MEWNKNSEDWNWYKICLNAVQRWWVWPDGQQKLERVLTPIWPPEAKSKRSEVSQGGWG